MSEQQCGPGVIPNFGAFRPLTYFYSPPREIFRAVRKMKCDPAIAQAFGHPLEDAMTCPGCGMDNPPDSPECWSCTRLLGCRGLTCLSDKRYQLKVGRRTHYFHRVEADEADMRVLNLANRYYFEAEVENEPVREATITAMVNRLRAI